MLKTHRLIGKNHPNPHSVRFTVFLTKKRKKNHEKSKNIFQKPIDKTNDLCYNTQVVSAVRLIFCRCGGIGRRPGLKIP